MKYIIFKIGEKDVAIPYSLEYGLEPTLINKITSISNKKNKLISGVINYKGKVFDVLDISSMYKLPPLKKFDGLIFVTREGKLGFAIQFEGFYKIVNELENNEEILEIGKIKF